MSDLQSLIERVEKATGPDREIEFDLWRYEHNINISWCGGVARAINPNGTASHSPLAFIDPGKHSRNFYMASNYEAIVPAYTASIDAALSLVERKLPGWAIGFRTCAVWAPHHHWAGKPVWEAIVADMGDCDSYYPWGDDDGWEEQGVVEFEVDHCAPALAICLALLKAVQAQAAPPEGSMKGNGE